MTARPSLRAELRRALGRWARAWANHLDPHGSEVVARETPAPSSAATPAAEPAPGPPVPSWEAGPPAHWLEYVRARNPGALAQLLQPEGDSIPTRAGVREGPAPPPSPAFVAPGSTGARGSDGDGRPDDSERDPGRGAPRAGVARGGARAHDDEAPVDRRRTPDPALPAVSLPFPAPPRVEPARGVPPPVDRDPRSGTAVREGGERPSPSPERTAEGPAIPAPSRPVPRRARPTPPGPRYGPLRFDLGVAAPPPFPEPSTERAVVPVEEPGIGSASPPARPRRPREDAAVLRFFRPSRPSPGAAPEAPAPPEPGFPALPPADPASRASGSLAAPAPAGGPAAGGRRAWPALPAEAAPEAVEPPTAAEQEG